MNSILRYPLNTSVITAATSLLLACGSNPGNNVDDDGSGDAGLDGGADANQDTQLDGDLDAVNDTGDAQVSDSGDDDTGNVDAGVGTSI